MPSTRKVRRFTMELNPKMYNWVRREAVRTGSSVVQIVRYLIAEKMSAKWITAQQLVERRMFEDALLRAFNAGGRGATVGNSVPGKVPSSASPSLQRKEVS